MLSKWMQANEFVAQEANQLEQAVERTVRSAFQESNYQAIREVSCEFHSGVVTLRGTVPTFFLKQVAQHIAGKLMTVSRIDNRLEVVS
jgi:osmotically-inducible protein OsmY